MRGVKVGGVRLAVLVVDAVCRSFLANRTGSNRWVVLGPVAPLKNTPPSPEQIREAVDRIVGLIVRNTGHPCLYYGYARCRALRRYGYLAQLNLGLAGLKPDLETGGHCWVSLDDGVLFEERDPASLFPDRLGERGDIVYWTRFRKERNETVRRERNEPVSCRGIRGGQ
ncbi:MAG: hypothetical protein Kow0089_10240 [Desulfobulbaceae bacterium]